MIQKKEIQASQNKLNLVAGKYVAAKEKEGNFGGFVVNKVLSGISMTFAEPFAGLEATQNRYDYLSPEEKAYYKSIKYNGKNLTKDQIENLLDNQAVLKAKNQAKENIIDVLGSEGTTLEYMKSGDRGFITQAIGGVLESLPAMATGGKPIHSVVVPITLQLSFVTRLKRKYSLTCGRRLKCLVLVNLASSSRMTQIGD